MSWFGKPKKEVASSPQDAIQKLQETEELLQKKSDYLEAKITGELRTARAAGTKNKRVALNALKRKRRFEEQLNKIDGTLSTIEFQREALENASTNTEVLKNMQHASQALKAAHKNMDVEQVHDIMDDMQEQQEIANEISDAISAPVGFGEMYDEDDLLAELEGMEQEDIDRELLDIPSGAVPTLPSVPDSSISSRTQPAEEEDDDMAALAAWAN